MNLKSNILVICLCLFVSCNKNHKNDLYNKQNLRFVINDSLSSYIMKDMGAFAKAYGGFNYKMIKLQFGKKNNIDYVKISTASNFISDSILYCQEFEGKFIFVYKNKNPDILKYFYVKRGFNAVPDEFVKYQVNSDQPVTGESVSQIYKIVNKSHIVRMNIDSNQVFNDNAAKIKFIQ